MEPVHTPYWLCLQTQKSTPQDRKAWATNPEGPPSGDPLSQNCGGDKTKTLHAFSTVLTFSGVDVGTELWWVKLLPASMDQAVAPQYLCLWHTLHFLKRLVSLKNILDEAIKLIILLNFNMWKPSAWWSGACTQKALLLSWESACAIICPVSWAWHSSWNTTDLQETPREKLWLFRPRYVAAVFLKMNEVSVSIQETQLDPWPMIKSRLSSKN